MLDTDRQWLAGWLEGEGAFLRGSPSAPNNARVVAITTDRDVAERAAALMGCSVGMRKARRPHHKQQYVVTRAGGPARLLMRELRPLMGERRQEAIERALRSYRPRRKGLLTAAQALQVKQLYNEGMKPSEIIRELRIPGMTRDVVRAARETPLVRLVGEPESAQPQQPRA